MKRFYIALLMLMLGSQQLYPQNGTPAAKPAAGTPECDVKVYDQANGGISELDCEVSGDASLPDDDTLLLDGNGALPVPGDDLDLRELSASVGRTQQAERVDAGLRMPSELVEKMVADVQQKNREYGEHLKSIYADVFTAAIPRITRRQYATAIKSVMSWGGG